MIKIWNCGVYSQHKQNAIVEPPAQRQKVGPKSESKDDDEEPEDPDLKVDWTSVAKDLVRLERRQPVQAITSDCQEER